MDPVTRETPATVTAADHPAEEPGYPHAIPEITENEAVQQMIIPSAGAPPHSSLREQIYKRRIQVTRSKPSDVDEEDILDWDATPGNLGSPSRDLPVRLEWVEYGPPLPFEDPWAE